MKIKEKIDLTPHESGFYFVARKDSGNWEALMKVSTHEYGNRIYIHCDSVTPLFSAHNLTYIKDLAENILFSDDYKFSDKINLTI